MDSHVKKNCACSSDQLRAKTIRELNDNLRCHQTGGTMYVTRGVTSLGVGMVPLIIEALAGFDGFSPENDPYDEHDFGSFTFGAEKIFWKIDYYDNALEYGSPDPADSAVTTRVLTVMLASEY